MHWMTTLMYVLTFIIGVVTASIGFSIQGDISSSSHGCSETLQKANTGVIVLATIMLTATIVLGYCSYSCASGSSSGLEAEDKISKELMAGYYGFMLILSIVLTTLGALIKNNAKDNTQACPNAESKGNFIMAIGIVGIVIMLGPFAVKLAYHGGKHAKKLYDTRSSSFGHKMSSA